VTYSPLVPDRLRPLWNFDDLDGTERRLHAQLEEEGSDPGRAEVLSQLARVQGLLGDFDACERLLQEAESLAGDDTAARIRIDLERGRAMRSSGRPEAAVPFFEAAFDRAKSSGEAFLAGDAAHMVAIADPDRMVEWTNRGLQLAEAEPEASYWAGPLLNNLGWHHVENGDYATALPVFERALEARERDPDDPVEIEIARYAVGRTLRLLGRPTEAASLLEHCVANSEPDPYFHEELGEIYALLGREEEAREQSRLAARLR
jgi:tetratricopeptide (TPR) repeat protein